MRVVVIGATGNVGTAVLRALRDEEAVDEIVGVARRRRDTDGLKVPGTPKRTSVQPLMVQLRASMSSTCQAPS